MGMADAAGDVAKAPNVAPNRAAATRPILRVMMSSSAYAIQNIEVVLIKLWRKRNVMLMNKFSKSARLAGLGRMADAVPETLILRNSQVCRGL